ncbi:exonuclease domain-containing protein [soil metagenome]
MARWNVRSRWEADREAILNWAQSVALNPQVVFLDTETTGVGGDAEICDIAVVASDGRVLLNTLVKPKRPIPPDASRIHGIYDHHVAGALSWEQVYPRFVDVIAQRQVVVYNADYDQGVISRCCLSCRVNLPLSRWDCAMKAYSAYVGEPASHSRGGYRWFKLDQASAAFGINPGGHRAAADAEACRLVVHAMANAGMKQPLVAAWDP